MDEEQRNEARMIAVLDRIIEPGTKDDRLLIANVAARLNAQLPRENHMKNRRDLSDKLSPAVLMMIPTAEKRRTAGQIWIYGVKMKDQLAEAAE
jgi:hypothetical protein